MEKRSYTQVVKNYLQLNWFKLTLLGMLIFVFLRKDLSFQFHLNNPSQKIEQGIPSGAEQAPVQARKEKEELLTQEGTPQPVASPKPMPKNQTVLSSIELPFFSSYSPGESGEIELSVIDASTRQAYIKRFGQVAISESKKYGIPASIILANAIIHSNYGQRNLTLNGQNHFGLPCTGGWQGGSGNYDNNCYRHYDNAWMSFRDHSLYLTSGKFAPLRQLSSGDYKAWAAGLEKLAYSDIYDNLASRMIELIDEEELYGFDMR